MRYPEPDGFEATAQARRPEPDPGPRNISRRAALRAFAGAAALVAAAPVAAFAEGETATESTEAAAQGIEDGMESWRYSGGSVIAAPKTDPAESGFSTLATTEELATWSSSNGTDSYCIGTCTYDNSGNLMSVSEHTTVAVSGVQRVGIDVSKWNGTIDWDEVADDGISFAIIRCGYGSNYTSQDDSYWATNVTGALNAGLDIGVYLYSYATTVTGSDGSAESEAAHVVRLLSAAGLTPSKVALPIFLDMEDSTQAGCSTSTLGSIAQTFCDAIQAEGYQAGIYANKNWWTNYLTDNAFSNSGWYRWVARYPASSNITSTGVDNTDIWQFTSIGKVNGNGSSWMDVNFDYLGADGYDGASLPFSVQWMSHVQSVGTKSGTSRASTISLGTTGLAKRLEAFSLAISGSELSGSITYRAHVQTYSWQGWVSDGDTSGTSGLSKRLEAVQIELTDELAENYDIYYRTHCQTYGWLGWAKNGEVAGTIGLSKRVEALQVYFVEKDADTPGSTSTPSVQNVITATAHVQTYGWQSGTMASGATVLSLGTTGLAKRLEAITLKLGSAASTTGGITYRTHVQTYGWQSWVSDGATSGTTGKSKRLEAVQIQLTGSMADDYDIYYRTHCQTYGWLGWAKNGDVAGTSGYSKRMESIQIALVPKDGTAPGSTSNAYKSAS